MLACRASAFQLPILLPGQGDTINRPRLCRAWEEMPKGQTFGRRNLLQMRESVRAKRAEKSLGLHFCGGKGGVSSAGGAEEISLTAAAASRLMGGTMARQGAGRERREPDEFWGKDPAKIPPRGRGLLQTLSFDYSFGACRHPADIRDSRIVRARADV
jgi:hypothetical protein